MEIDKMEFTFWMKRIMERFDVLSDQLDSGIRQKKSIDGDELLDNQDVLQMLKISSRSLQRYRTSGRLPYCTISGKLYYKSSDVHHFIRSSFSNSFEKFRTPRDK
ncbi:helix-turn-helix protein [Chryseobacterium sp. 52]|uniref:helix-turn-helix domain-containing protein n=1 Tax=Chryseobacterium sp. 52 TaxID=2035213 RepID=UPI000C179E13|nr:helix-turn-helix domain-containing protein [Chryseobacterium sp. 52]PIF45291.1 helix-turn-helix protein [Chryseobacterium sp. 52]